MSQWKYTLKIKDGWQAKKEGTLSLENLIKSIIKKLKQLNIKNDSELEDIIETFELAIEDDDITVDEFDEIWETLYDWADQETKQGQWPPHKLCWIETF